MRVHSAETLAKMSASHKGKKQTQAWVEKRSQARRAFYDKVGRKSVLSSGIKGRREYKEWRNSVFKRDGYSCVLCGDKRGNNLEADHIIPFSYLVHELILGAMTYEELFTLEVGRTLCEACHKKTNTWGRKCLRTPWWQIYKKIKGSHSRNNNPQPFEEYYDKVMNWMLRNMETVLDNVDTE